MNHFTSYVTRRVSRSALALNTLLLFSSLLFSLFLQAAPPEQQSKEELRETIRHSPFTFSNYYHLVKRVFGIEPEENDVAGLEQSGDFYEDALVRKEAGDLEGAVIQLRNAIDADSDNLSAYLLISETYSELRIPQGAEYHLRIALETGANPGLVMLPLGRALIEQGKFQDASDLLLPAALEREERAPVRLLKARAYIGLQQWDAAREELNSAVKDNPHDIHAPLQLARMDLARGDVMQAQARLDALHSNGLKPDTEATYWLVVGQMAQGIGDIETALRAYDEALTRDNKNQDVLHLVATLRLELNQLDTATAHIDVLRALYPQDLRGLLAEISLALKLDDDDRFDLAVINAYQIIDTVDFARLQRDPYNLLLIGSIHQATGNLEEASSLLATYHQLAPQDFGALLSLARVELDLNRVGRASSLLESVSSEFGDNIAWHHLKAEVLTRQERLPEALQEVDKALALRPNDLSATLKRASLLTSLGGAEAAIAQLAELRKSNKTPEIAVTLANIALLTGRFEYTIKLADEIMESNGFHETALNLKAGGYLGLENLDAARRTYLEILESNPTSTTALFNLATINLSQGELSPAEQGLLAIINIDRNHVLALSELSKISQSSGNLPQATRYLSTAYAAKPQLEIGLRLLDLRLKQNQSTEVSKLFLDMKVNHPDDLEVLAAEAQWNRRNQNPSRAIQLYDGMVNMAGSQRNIEALFRIAHLQLEVGNVTGAKDALDAIVAIDQNGYFKDVLTVELHLRAQQYDEALSISQRIIDVFPEQTSGYQLKGDTLSLMSRYGEAAEVYASGIDKVGNGLALALKSYGALREESGVDAAMKFLEPWIIDNKVDAFSAQRALAAGYADQGKLTAAIELNESLLAKYPDNSSLLNNLALLYFQTADDRARHYAQRAYDQDPTNPAVMDTLGWVLVNEGNVSLGLTLLRNAVARTADLPEIRYHYAVALERNGQNALAKRELLKALASGKRFSGETEAKVLLNRL